MEKLSKHLSKAAYARLCRLEEGFTVTPHASGAGKWQDEPEEVSAATGHLTKPCAADEPAWHKVTPVTRPGVCRLFEARVWSLRASSPSIASDPYRRLAIVFDKQRRRLRLPNSPHVWGYYLKHGEWRRRQRHTTRLEGRIALLGNFVSDSSNYYHFWADIIADIWYLRRSLPAADMPQRFLMAYTGAPWQRQILQLCGIQEEQIIPLADHDWLRVEELVVPLRPKGSEDQPTWQAHAIRAMAHWHGSEQPATRRLYLSRADAPRRRVANETQVLEALEPLGFEAVTLGGLSVREQQALFASAAVIVAPHGAALTNLVWCQPGTTAVDFLSSTHLVPCFRELSIQSGVDYHPVVCRSMEDTALGFDSDLVIGSAQLDATLALLKREKGLEYSV